MLIIGNQFSKRDSITGIIIFFHTPETVDSKEFLIQQLNAHDN